MHPLFDLRPESRPTVLAAFQGWNDVAGAAVLAIDTLIDVTNARLWAEMDPEDYYDFQVNQPHMKLIDGERRVEWQTTRVYHATLPGLGDVMLIRGIEPSFRWKAFVEELLDAFTALDPARVVFLGAVPGETPHTRPLPVTATSPQETTRVIRNAEAPTYVGPTGIIGVLIDTVSRAHVETLALWVIVPQYASGGPQPKAALALLHALGSMFKAGVPLGDLEEESRAWERGVAELAATDAEITAYIEGLEQTNDLAELPEASGDAIAEQFEQFLRRRDEGTL